MGAGPEVSGASVPTRTSRQIETHYIIEPKKYRPELQPGGLLSFKHL